MDISVEDEAVFWDIKIQVLHELRDELVKNIYPDKFFAYLRTRRVLDADDCDDISAERTRRRQAEKFLDVLESKGPDAFDEFCEILRKNKTQLYLLTKICDKFHEKRQEIVGPSFPIGSSSFPVELNTGQSKSMTNVVLPSTTIIPDTVVGVRDNSYLPAPGDPGAPIPPAEGITTSSLPMMSIVGQNDATMTGNSVAQPTSQDSTYPGPTPPPYSSLSPEMPPPPYTA